MEKIFKKSLALMVSAALCLTAFVGCLTVNAEATATPTYTITAQNGKAGDTVTVNVDGNNLTSVCGQQVFINIPSDLTIVSVKDNAGKAYVNVADVAKGEAFDYSVVTTETTKQVRFADIINFDTLTTAEFHIVFELTIPDTAAVGAKYEIAFDTATMFADINENAIGITVTPKTITVQPAGPEKIDVTYAHSLALESKILVNMYVLQNEQMNACENLYMVCTKRVYQNGELTSVPTTLEVYNRNATVGSNKYYWFVYDGIAAKEFGCTFTSMIYGTDAEGNRIYESANIDTYSCLTYAANKLKASNSTVKLKNLISAMLVYCSAAQVRFEYDVDNLVKNDSSVSSYIVETSDLTDLTNSKTLSGEGFSISNSLALESTVELTFAFAKSATGITTAEELAASDYKVVIYDETGTNVLKTFNASDITAYGTSYWCVNYSDLAAKEFGKVVVCKVFDGETQVSQTETYSIESYAASQCSKTPPIAQAQYDVLQAMMKYSRAAVAYFS